MARPPTHFLVRLHAKIQQGAPDACWPWLGARSASSSHRIQEASPYGAFQEGGRGSRIWRVHRLVLLLASVPDDLPGWEILAWVRVADRAYAHLEVGHQCDYSLCCNPAHLAWETHLENVQGQRFRQDVERLAQAWVEVVA